MSPFYEDAAHLLRFLVARGLTLPNCMTHHEIIIRLACDIEYFVKFRGMYTHAEAAEILVGTINSLNDCLYGWLDKEPDKRKKYAAVIGSMIGNLLSRHETSIRR